MKQDSDIRRKFDFAKLVTGALKDVIEYMRHNSVQEHEINTVTHEIFLNSARVVLHEKEYQRLEKYLRLQWGERTTRKIEVDYDEPEGLDI